MYTLRFVDGTLVLDPPLEQAVSHDAPAALLDGCAPPDCFKSIKGKWRCEAYWYPTLTGWLQQMKPQVRDNVPRWSHLDLVLQDGYDLHDYQRDALEAWQANEQRGCIVLPTGAGKTVVALRAIAATGRSALVVAPTIDLMHQWYARLVDTFGLDTGVWYGREKILKPLMVTTYHSANEYIGEWGNQFKLLIFDEVHHLPAPGWQEIPMMSPAPFRLGLTATYPEPDKLGRDEHNAIIERMVGAIAYRKHIKDLTGSQLAEYRTERIRVDLTPAEREYYDENYAVYTGFVNRRNLRGQHGAGWWHHFTRMSAFDPEARAAKVAEQRCKRILSVAEGKLDKLEMLLKSHANERVLIFTADNRLVYRIARTFLVPAITCDTPAAERKRLLDGFRGGQLPALVTSRVLNEGVDVPEAKIAIVLGGTASTREYIQRLGRILRKYANREAVLYEIIVRNTTEEGVSSRRRNGKALK